MEEHKNGALIVPVDRIQSYPNIITRLQSLTIECFGTHLESFCMNKIDTCNVRVMLCIISSANIIEALSGLSELDRLQQIDSRYPGIIESYCISIIKLDKVEIFNVCASALYR